MGERIADGNDVFDDIGSRFSKHPYNEVRAKLTEMFSGLTAYTRAPAGGLWNTGSTVKSDDIIFVEVMTDELDRSS